MTHDYTFTPRTTSEEPVTYTAESPQEARGRYMSERGYYPDPGWVYMTSSDPEHPYEPAGLRVWSDDQDLANLTTSNLTTNVAGVMVVPYI